MKYFKWNKSFLLLVMSVLVLTSCGSKEVDVVFKSNTTENDIIGIESDYSIFILDTEIENNTYDLNVQVEKLATTEIIGKYGKDSTFVSCEITAPDVYSYLMNNMEILNELDTEQLYQNIMEYIKEEECPQRKVKVDIPAEYKDGKLVVDTESFEYQDAVTGGMNSALTELYLLWLTEVDGEVK